MFRRPQIAMIMAMRFASHVVLDVIQHEPDIRLVPWLAHPTLGLNLAGNPWADFAVETPLSLACWAYYRGGIRLLIVLVLFNVSNLPLMLAGEGAATVHGRTSPS
jgi:hypothetical protein